MLKIHKHAIHIWSCCFIAWIASRASSFIAWIASRACNFIAWIGSISATFLCIIQNMFLHFFHEVFPAFSTFLNKFWILVFCNFLWCFVHFYFRVQRKRVETNMDPIFEHPVFDSSRESVKRTMRQLEKPQESLETSLYTCFKCESNKIFSIAKQNRSADEGITVFSECRDCHYKWRYWLCDKFPINGQMYQTF